jgi:hypothetical protein
MIAKFKFFSIIIVLFLLQILTSCNSGYEQINDSWSYVSYDEGVGKRIRNIDVDNITFEIINNDYAKDNIQVFYKGRKIENADSETFELLEDGYSKDKNNVYLYGYPIVNANPSSFEILGGLFSRDENNIYNGTIPLKIDDISSFKVTEPKEKISTISTKEFIKKNPSYSFINIEKYKVVVYSNSIGRTNKEIFEGFRKIQ